MLWILLLYKLIACALSNSLLYEAVWSSKTTRWARLFSASILSRSVELQKCNTVEQYWKFGTIKALYSLSLLVALSISLWNLIITLSSLFTLVQTCGMCLLKLRSLSIVVPSRSRESSAVKENLWSVDPRIIAWCLVELTIIPLTEYQWFALRTSLQSVLPGP